jgi:hypothetical protein
MRKLAIFIGLALAGLVVGALSAQTNPQTQITWPRVTGSGVPTATCPSTTNTTTTATLGTPYTDTSANTFYICSTAGWTIVAGSGSGLNQLIGDVTAGPGTGSQAATVKGLDGVLFCAGFTPTNGQAIEYTTASSPNPCYTAATPSGSGSSVTVNGGGALGTANFNGTTPAASSGFQNSTLQVSGANVSVENPLASSSVFGLAKVDNTTITASAGVISATATPLPTATAPGQIITSIAAGTTYAPQGRIFYSQTGDTIASIETECSSLCTYVVTVPQTITLSSSHALSSNVLLRFENGGLWTVNGAFTLTLGQVSGTRTQHFAGSSTIAGLSGVVPVEWFGAVGTTLTAAVSGTNYNTQIQAAINAVTKGGAVEFQCLAYQSTGTLLINLNSQSLKGECAGFDFTVGAPPPIFASIIVSNSASADIIDVGGTAPLPNATFFNQITNLSVIRSVLPTGTVKGISFNHAANFYMQNIVSSDSSYDFYFHDSGEGAIATNLIADWGQSITTGYSTQTLSGIYIDSADGEETNTIQINYPQIACQQVPSTTATGLSIVGVNTNDVDVSNLQAAACSYGVFINQMGSSGGGDIQFTNTTADLNSISGIMVENTAANFGASFNGGWIFNANSGGTCSIDLASAGRVTINSMQIYGENSGICLTNSSYNTFVNNAISASSLTGNSFSLSGSTNNTIVNNTMGGSGSGVAINLSSTSTNNIIANNPLISYATGINCDGTSLTNQVGLNIFTSVTTSMTGCTLAYQVPVTLTTAGSSGASTFNPATGALNVPTYSGGGSATIIQVNGTPTSTATPVNLENSTANVTGLALGITNPSAGNVLTEINGTINAAHVATLNQSTTGNAATATLATTATNLAGGALSSFPYQNSAGATLFVAGSAVNGTYVPAEVVTGSALVAPTLLNLAATYAPLTNPTNGQNNYAPLVMTTLGDTLFENGTPAYARLAGNTTAAKNFLCQTGTGSVSAAPVWCLLASGDIPNNAANTTGNAGTATNISTSGTANQVWGMNSGATAQGWQTVSGGSITFPQTVAGTTTSGGIPYFSSTTALSSSALLPTGDFVLGGGAGGAPTATFSVVPIANGGTGSATVATDTVFGNPTGSTAAPVFTNSPVVTNITASGSLSTGKINATSASNNIVIGAPSGVIMPTNTPFVLMQANGNLDTNNLAATNLIGFETAQTFSTLSGSLTVTGSWIADKFAEILGTGSTITYNGSTPLTQLSLTPTYNVNTSSTTGYCVICTNVTETSIGSAPTNYFERYQVGGSTRYSLDSVGNLTTATYNTNTNCASAASPAVCGSAAAGAFTVAAATTSIVVNTTAVTANSDIEIQPDTSLGTRLSVTCNSTLASIIGPIVTARTPGTSFTVSITGTLVTNPACYSYTITN